jgi:hypothetical protein
MKISNPKFNLCSLTFPFWRWALPVARVCAWGQSIIGYRFKLGGGPPTHTICYCSRHKIALKKLLIARILSPRYAISRMT